MSEPASKTYCVAPWISVAITSQGGIQPCCTFRHPLGSYDHPESLRKTWESPEWTALRNDLSSGREVSGCRNCDYNERSGRASRREKLNRRYGDVDARPLPRLLELRFSNACNLNCVMCDSSFSSSWRKHDASLAALGLRGQTAGEPGSHRISERDLPGLLEFARSADEVEILGGEPLLDPQCRAFLRALSKTRPDVGLSLVTNGTIADEEIVSLLAAFPNLTLSLSIDGTGRVYEYVRGYAFRSIEENLARFLTAQPEPRRKLLLHHTTSVYNALELPVFLSWLEKTAGRFPERIRGVFDQIVSGPEYLSPSLIPVAFREKLSARLDELIPRMESCARTDGLRSLSKFLRHSRIATGEEALLEKAKKLTSFMNDQRGFAIWDVQGELGFLR